MTRIILGAAMIALTGGAAMADCYGWRNASDFGRAEDQWQCGECLERGHMPGPGKMGAYFCVPEVNQNGTIGYLYADKVFADFDGPGNGYCGCGLFALD